MSKPLRVAVHAALNAGQAGGTEQVVIGLVSALSKLQDGNEEYLILGYERGNDWFEPYIGGRARLLPVIPTPRIAGKGGMLGPLRPLARFVRDELHLLRGPASIPLPPEPEGLTRERPDVIHFPKQNAFITTTPNIFHPWDLLHLNRPELFSRYQHMMRERTYRAYCRQATLVSVASPWVASDLTAKYGIPRERIAVVPMAPPTEQYAEPTAADIAATRAKFELPERFLYYPAQTYPHKNHLRLFEALDIIRRRHSVEIPLVCSGFKNTFYPKLEEDLRRRRMESQVRFVGFVTPIEIQCLYRTALAMVFPTECEGWGLPIQEAFAAGTPVASSNIMSLPDQTGDAALLFDPASAEQIADCLWRLWTDEELRRELVRRGANMVAGYSWDRTARLFRAYYRRLGGAPLTDEDQRLLRQ